MGKNKAIIFSIKRQRKIRCLFTANEFKLHSPFDCFFSDATLHCRLYIDVKAIVKLAFIPGLRKIYYLLYIL